MQTFLIPLTVFPLLCIIIVIGLIVLQLIMTVFMIQWVWNVFVSGYDYYVSYYNNPFWRIK